jgi:hypothetical protein
VCRRKTLLRLAVELVKLAPPAVAGVHLRRGRRVQWHQFIRRPWLRCPGDGRSQRRLAPNDADNDCVAEDDDQCRDDEYDDKHDRNVGLHGESTHTHTHTHIQTHIHTHTESRRYTNDANLNFCANGRRRINQKEIIRWRPQEIGGATRNKRKQASTQSTFVYIIFYYLQTI